ncbi:hypothetical protein ACIB24_03735 [Spongisporangium articulatum]|uniref:Uncharacterized protein n=1 Tax=Spongisporangium articulatum TaxID=3362603 RepID=A0ABW8AII0_9ACTN
METYQPTTRMAKALRLGMLQATRQWLAEAAREHPGATPEELLELITDEALAAELELERYDELDTSRPLLPSRNLP